MGIASAIYMTLYFSTILYAWLITPFYYIWYRVI